jgi:hypothetical protein
MASSIFLQPGGVTSDGAGNVTVSGQLLLADGSFAAPSLAFTNQTGLGLVRSGNGLIDWMFPAYSTTQSMFRFNTSFGFVMGANRGYAFATAGGGNFSAVSCLYCTAANTIQLSNGAATVGVGLDFSSNNLVLVRNLAFSAYATVDTLGLKSSGSAGQSFGPSAVASLTTVNGIVTAAS